MKIDFLDPKVKPRAIESYFSDLLLKTFGNKVQDEADISAAKGSFHVYFAIDGAGFAFDFKRKSAARIVKAIRALKKVE